MPEGTFHAAHLERIRCAIARDVFRFRFASTRIFARIAPRHHPWRILTESAAEDLYELTTTTLRPRTANGDPQLHVSSRPTRSAFGLLSFSLATRLTLLYILLAITSTRVPEPGNIFEFSDERIRIIDRTAAAVQAFLS